MSILIYFIEMGVTVKVDSPGVGKNLQSQVGTGDIVFTLRDPVSFNAIRLYANPLNLISYFIQKEGPLAAVSGFDGMGNIRVNTIFNSSSSDKNQNSSHVFEEPNWPDIQISMLALHVGMV